MPKKGAKKRPAGRPRFEFDMGLVERLAQISCTDGEIAAACGCSVDTLARRRADEPGFAETIERAREAGKSSLRRAQWKAALSGDRTMLIWLGKQHLGQQDKSAHEHSGPGGEPIQVKRIEMVIVDAGDGDSGTSAPD
jgi:hypothetical protein